MILLESKFSAETATTAGAAMTQEAIERAATFVSVAVYILNVSSLLSFRAQHDTLVSGRTIAGNFNLLGSPESPALSWGPPSPPFESIVLESRRRESKVVEMEAFSGASLVVMQVCLGAAGGAVWCGFHGNVHRGAAHM